MTNEVEKGLVNEVGKGLVKNESSKNPDAPVRIIGFISGNWSNQMGIKKNKMPENYLNNTELPKPLIELTKKNGWTDKDGNVYFKEDWQPEPYFDEEKNITWILANDKTNPADIISMSASAYVNNHEV